MFGGRSRSAVRAVVAARYLADDDLAVSVAHLLCDGLYLEGRTPDDPGQIENVGDAVGIGGQALLMRWDSAEGRAAVQREYARARDLGVTTYPSLFVRHVGAGHLIPVVSGFAPADVIVDQVRRATRTVSPGGGA